MNRKAIQLIAALATCFIATAASAASSNALAKDPAVKASITAMQRWEKDSLALEKATASFVAVMRVKTIDQKKASATWKVMMDAAETARVSRKTAFTAASKVADRLKAAGMEDATTARFVRVYERANKAFEAALDRHIKVRNAVIAAYKKQ